MLLIKLNLWNIIFNIFCYFAVDDGGYIIIPKNVDKLEDLKPCHHAKQNCYILCLSWYNNNMMKSTPCDKLLLIYICYQRIKMLHCAYLWCAMLAVVVFLVLLVRAAHSGSGSCAKNVLWETEISQQFNKVSEMENEKCLPQMVWQLMLWPCQEKSKSTDDWVTPYIKASKQASCLLKSNNEIFSISKISLLCRTWKLDASGLSETHDTDKSH